MFANMWGLNHLNKSEYSFSKPCLVYDNNLYFRAVGTDFPGNFIHSFYLHQNKKFNTSLDLLYKIITSDVDIRK